MPPARRRSSPEILAQRGELTVERDPRRRSGRLLRHATMDSSYVDVADPTHLEFDYLRWMRIVLRVAGAQRVLHIGGGGCALARALAAEDPNGLQEVCEIDADVLAIARDHLGLRRAPGLRVREIDGLEFLASRPEHRSDAVVIDAYIGAAIPEALLTERALGLARGAAPLALINVVDDRGRRVVIAVARACARAGFSSVSTVGARAGNVVVVAVSGPLDGKRITQQLAADPTPAAFRAAARIPM